MNNNSSSGSVLKTLIICLVFAGILALLDRSGFGITYLIAIAIGFVVAGVNYFCLEPVYNNSLYARLINHGVDGEAFIDRVAKRVVHPSYIQRGPDRTPVVIGDESEALTAYTLELSYYVGGVEYRKSVITPYTKPSNLLPYFIQDGSKIPIKYLPNNPKKFMIAIPAMMHASLYATQKMLYKGPFFGAVITAIYVYYIVTRFF